MEGDNQMDNDDMGDNQEQMDNDGMDEGQQDYMQQ